MCNPRLETRKMLQHWSCVFGLFKKDNGKPVVNYFFSFLYIYPSTRGSLSSIYVSFIFLTLSLYLSFPLSLPLFLILHLSIYVYKYLSMKPVKVTPNPFFQSFLPGPELSGGADTEAGAAAAAEDNSEGASPPYMVSLADFDLIKVRNDA